MQLDRRRKFYVLLFGVVYLTWCDFAMDSTKDQHLMLCKSRKSATETLQRLHELSGKEACTVHGKSKLTIAENGETSGEKSEEHSRNFIWHQGVCSQIVHPGLTSSQFGIILWRFKATAWKCAKPSLQTLATRELAVASRQRTFSHFLFQQIIFYQKQYDCRAQTTLIFSPPDWR
jgi:hypothetical protein